MQQDTGKIKSRLQLTGTDFCLSATIPKKMKMHIFFLKEKEKKGAPGKTTSNTGKEYFKVYYFALQ